jgi:S-DNA-T family DNA segregation ATPase FtsK/SpoIIIE
LSSLPHVVEVATGDDLEAVTRQLGVLTTELARRRRLLGDARAEHLTAYNARHEPLPRVLVLLDGMGTFNATFAGGGGSMGMTIPPEAWLDRFVDLVVEGRQVGIHVVLTADRRNAVPSRLHAAVGNRLILRHADETGYTEHGIPTSVAKDLELEPGRGLWNATTIVQVAVVSDEAGAEAQARALAELGAAARGAGRAAATLRTRALPDVLDLAELPAATGPLRAPFGVIDISGETAELDLTWSSALVAGAGRTGRSTALSTIGAALVRHHDVWAIGGTSSGMTRAGWHECAFGRGDVVGPVLDRLANILDLGGAGAPPILVIDDLDGLDDASLNPMWDRLARHDALRVVASIDLRALSGFTTNPLMNAVRRARRVLVLAPDDGTELLQAVGVKSPVRPGQRLGPGRGVYIRDRQPVVVQVAICRPVSPVGADPGWAAPCAGRRGR